MRSVPKELAEGWCAANGLDLNLLMETSSKTKENVEEAFLLALSAWRSRNSKNFDFSLSTRRLDLSVGDLAKIRKRSKTGKNNCIC